MRRVNNNFAIHRFFCTSCGRENIPLARLPGQHKEPGHLKNLYCIYCCKEVNNCECDNGKKYTKNDFDLEFKYKNFTPEGIRKKPYPQFKNELIKRGIIV